MNGRLLLKLEFLYRLKNKFKIEYHITLKTFLYLLLTSVLLTACSNSQVTSQNTRPSSGVEPASRVIPASDVQWVALNPARGDKSPKAGTLWGDRTGSGPSGFLVKFVDGFSSPAHIHNITYRGVVISGLVHNDHPDADNHWMSVGSYWTQPAGAVHLTSAKGSMNLAYIEIEEGPYLVLSTKKAFDNGDRPVKVDASNIDWIHPPGTSVPSHGLKVALLWGKPSDGQLNGTLVKLSAGFSGELSSPGPTLRTVVIQGLAKHRMSNGTDIKTLEPGSYFSSKGELAHQVSCEAGKDCILYVRTEGKFGILPVPPGNYLSPIYALKVFFSQPKNTHHPNPGHGPTTEKLPWNKGL